jgi:hypothetical protein
MRVHIMMVTLSFPPSDPGLLAWSQNFLDLITATPTAYNLVAGDATSYLAVHTAYADALAACDPPQRNKTAVVAKNLARTALKQAATLLANKVYAGASVTDAQKTQLGIPPRQSPSPIPAPTTAPVIEIISSTAWTVRIRLRDANGANRGKPAGTQGASIFSFIGPAAPTDLGQWKFEGSTGRVTKIDVAFPSDLPGGTKVWFTSFWFNGRKQSGPPTAPIGTNLPGGSVSMGG